MIRQPAAVGRYALALLWITLKRIVKNWRLVTPLLLGLVLASAFVAAVPIYSAASLQRSFIQHWREQDSFRAPFAVIPSHRNPRRKLPVTPAQLAGLERYLEDALQAAAGQPAQSFSAYRTFGVDFLMLSPEVDSGGRVARAELGVMSNLQEHAEVIDGRWFRDRQDGVVEVVAGGRTLDELELLVGSRYRWAYTLLPDEGDRPGGGRRCRRRPAHRAGAALRGGRDRGGGRGAPPAGAHLTRVDLPAAAGPSVHARRAVRSHAAGRHAGRSSRLAMGVR